MKKKFSKGLMIVATLLIIFNIWGFTTSTFTFVKPIMIGVDVLLVLYLFAKYKGKFSFLNTKKVGSGKKNYCPECGQDVNTPTCGTCGREIKVSK